MGNSYSTHRRALIIRNIRTDKVYMCTDGARDHTIIVKCNQNMKLSNYESHNNENIAKTFFRCFMRSKFFVCFCYYRVCVCAFFISFTRRMFYAIS